MEKERNNSEETVSESEETEEDDSESQVSKEEKTKEEVSECETSKAEIPGDSDRNEDGDIQEENPEEKTEKK